MDAVRSARSVIKCLSLLIGLLLLFEGSLGQSLCNTPRGTNGSCIIITDCKSLYDLLTKTPIPPDVKDFLKQSKCGLSGTTPNVCCPNDGITGFENDQESSDSDVIPNASSCGKSPQYKLLEGMKTEPDEYPWMALLEYTKPNGKGFHCGGFLVAERYVLTAAHCVSKRSIPRSYNLTGVRLGEYNTETEIDCTDSGECAPPPVNIEIDSIIIHEGYNPTNLNHENDIALIRLRSKVTYSSYIQPICLPVINDDIAKKNFTDYYLTEAGWGKMENMRILNVKLNVRIPVQELSVCNAKYNSQRVTLGQTQICAGGHPEKDSCIIASGGPLMAQEESGNGNWYAVGISSFGPITCGGSGLPDVYTKVASFSNWLSRNIK